MKASPQPDNPTASKPKHAALARPDLGEWARHELAILGAPCADIQALAARLVAALAPALRLGYVDADHAAGDLDVAATAGPLRQAGAWVEVTDKIHFRRRDEMRPLDRFAQQELLAGADLALVNGNHFRARQQLVVVDPRKPLERKLDRFTDVQAVLLAEGATEVPAYLGPYAAGRPVLPLADTAGLAAWLQTWLSARRPPLRGLVLAGGQSQRMRTDKGRLRYRPDGPEQRAAAAALLAEVCPGGVFVSCRAEQAAEIEAAGLVPLPDRLLGLGPVGGILTAFQFDPNAAWLVLACDLPFLTPDTLRHLAAARQPGRVATAFQSPRDEFPEPLVTVFEPRAYPELLRFLGLGYSCPRKMLINSDVAVLPPPAPRELRNVNTPEEREAALQELT